MSNAGDESMGPVEAIYLYTLYSIVDAIHCLGITEFDMNSTFTSAVFDVLVNADEWLVIRL